MVESSARPQTGVLFVCYANICRSPLAEGIFRELVERRGLASRFAIDSAGVSAWEGSAPHHLSVEVAEERGVALTGVSRQLVRGDFYDFDEVLVMDRLVYGEIRRLLGPSAFGPQAPLRARVRLFCALVDPRAEGRQLDVSDPITGGIDGFRATYDLLQRGCEVLLAELT